MEDNFCLYDQLTAGDLLTPIAGHLAKGIFQLQVDGRITDSQRLAYERPWLTAVEDTERCCSKWLSIYFEIYRIIPKGCRNCWKIAFRPKTVEDTFAVYELQKEMGINSKTGLERRGFTGNKGGYASFWYASLFGGLAEGRNIFRKVEAKLKERIGYTDSLILKRGCTEMEQFSNSIFGNSTQWDSRAQAFDLSEKLLDTVFDIPERFRGNAPEICENFIKRQWIEWAFEYGDETYLKFTGGRRLVEPAFNYMELKNMNFEIDSTWEEAIADRKSTIDSLV